MKTIIAGSREIDNPKLELGLALYACPFYSDITEIVTGDCQGIDKAGNSFARAGGIKLTIFPANWNRYGKKAGYLRNMEMATYADALIAVWDGESKGTKMMINIARKTGLKVFVYNTKDKR